MSALQKNIICWKCTAQEALLCLHYNRNDLYFHWCGFNCGHSGLRQSIQCHLRVLGLRVPAGAHLPDTSVLLGRHQSQLPREQLRLMHPALCFNTDWSISSPSRLDCRKRTINGGCQSVSITEQTYCMSICALRRIRNALLSMNYLLITVIFFFSFFFSFQGMLESGRSG